MNFFLCAALDCFLVPAGAVATATLTVVSILAMMITHTVAVTSGAITSVAVTSSVSLAVSSTRAGIRRNLACLELEFNPLIAHFCLQVADLSL